MKSPPLTPEDTPDARLSARGMTLSSIVSLALRELRGGGLKGFYVFVACVALGVAVITSVGAMSDALKGSLARQGEMLLGGDMRLSRPHQRITPKERAWLSSRGRVAEMVTLRTMARRPDLSEQTLVEIKGVDARYPLVGAVKLLDAKTNMAALMKNPGAIVDPILLEQLKLKVGDQLKIGKASFAINGVIEVEPDKLSSRLTYGPRVMLSIPSLRKTGLIQPGALVRWRYAWKLNEGRGETLEGLKAARAELQKGLPEAGFVVRDRSKPSPFVTRAIERLRQFLTLIGLTALLVGGVGVANAVNTFIDRRRKVIGTFKSLGASGRLIFQLHLVQVMLISLVGVVFGLLFGYLVPFILNMLFGAALPIEVEIAVTAQSALTAAAYGFLVALVFALWPLGRAEMVPAAVLFRDEVSANNAWPRPYVIAATVVLTLVLMGFALITSDSTKIATFFSLGLVVLFAVFLALGTLVTWIARRLPRSKIPEVALAIGNLGAPGGLTRSVVLSLGAGLSLLVAVALADAGLIEDLTNRTPEIAPNYFVLDIPKASYDDFEAMILKEAPKARIGKAPMLRGRLIKLAGVPVEKVEAPPEAQWVLTGDRGLSYDDVVPEGSKVVKGAWWPKDYDGEPLVSFEVDLAAKLGVEIGDMITVNVLGRNLTARISNLREVKWESLAINFVMVFSPNTLRAAPHNLLATISLPKNASLATEAALSRKIGRAFPAVTPIRVKEAINRFNAIFAKVMSAVRIAGGVTLLAGALVLAGALATAQRRRIGQAVILKTLGATRKRILASHFVEYSILAGVTALIAVGLGSIAAWVALEKVMEVEFLFSLAAVAQALIVSIVLVFTFGGLGTWRVLNAPPVPYLRGD